MQRVISLGALGGHALSEDPSYDPSLYTSRPWADPASVNAAVAPPNPASGNLSNLNLAMPYYADGPAPSVLGSQSRQKQSPGRPLSPRAPQPPPSVGLEPKWLLAAGVAAFACVWYYQHYWR